MTKTRKKEKTGKSKLVGWLVSYGLKENGEAFELRTGRTLVSSNGQSGDYLISLEDDSISEPHLAIKASSSHRLVVNDIFSKYGTFTQTAEDDEEQAIDGPVELKHGDWLRIGRNIRFQVCLIDGPGK